MSSNTSVGFFVLWRFGGGRRLELRTSQTMAKISKRSNSTLM
jgi:hypothetical protein